jgi:hypothetical protein
MPGRVRVLLDMVAALDLRMGRLEVVGDQTKAAIEDLRGAINEVAGELEALDARLVEGQTVDADTASALKPLADRLRGLRPDAVAEQPG